MKAPTFAPAAAPRKGGALRSLHRDRRGAAMAEFLVAFMPLMITFFSFVQLTQVATAKLVVKHAAVVGARAAAVMSNGKSNTPGMSGGSNQGQIQEGVRAALGPWASAMSSVNVEVADESGCTTETLFELVHVTVRAKFRCTVPLGNRIVCGAGGESSLEQKMSYPHQGARYKDLGGTSCSE